MTYKQFYIFCLTIIALVFTIRFLIIFKKLKTNKIEDELKNGLLFTALFCFSFFLVGLYKVTDQTVFSLQFLFNDRLLSSLSNIFLLSSIIYFPTKPSWINKQFQKSESWVIFVFLFFGIIITLFTLFDKLSINSGNEFQIALIIVDSIISTFVLALFGYVIAINQDLMDFKDNRIFIQIFLSLIIITQIALPLTKIFHDNLLIFYPYFLLIFIVSIFFLFQSLLQFFHTYFLKKIQFIDNSIEVHEINQINSTFNSNTLQLSYLKISYDTLNKKYILKLCLSSGDFSEKEIIVESLKILQPFSYWVLFAVAKKINIKIYNSDLAVARFRMVEFINKHYPDIKFSSESIFENDKGYYDLLIEPSNIVIDDIDLFLEKMQIKDVFLKHIDNFFSILNNSTLGFQKTKKTQQNKLELVLNAIKSKIAES